MTLTVKQKELFDKVDNINKISTLENITSKDEINLVLKKIFNYEGEIKDTNIVDFETKITNILTFISVSLRDNESIRTNKEFVQYLNDTYDKWEKLDQLVNKYWDSTLNDFADDPENKEYPGLIQSYK